MPLKKKLSKIAAIFRHARGWRGQFAMFKVFVKHGGLGHFKGIDHILTIPTRSSGAPLLHLRDTGSDGVVFTEILVDEDYAALRKLPFVPSSIFDIGVNIGLGSYYLRTLFPHASLVGFEPAPAERKIAAMNYASWGNAVLLEHAIGDQDQSEVGFAVHEDRTGGQHLIGDGELGDWQGITVSMRRIDSLIKEHHWPVPELVKMDIEGGEVQALEGFGEFLPQVKTFILETHSATLHAACIEKLQQAGFSTVIDFPRTAEARILCMSRQS